MAYTGFRGTAGGSVQSNYTDQPGVAVDGMIAFASDLNMVDSVFVDGAAGVFAGAGVTVAYNATGDFSLQTPNQAVSLPAGTEDINGFYGVVIFDEGMQSDSNGKAGWNDGRQARVLRKVRSGGRVWVKCPEAVTAGTSTVNWVIAGGSDAKYVAGQFSPAALAGDATHGTSVSLDTIAKFRTSCAAGGYAIIEFLG